jgi:hypothetical protein
VPRGLHGAACTACCWPWQGSRNAAGYGKTRFVLQGTAEVYAHRVAYALHFGRLAGPLEVCHSCNNPACCNWHHLWLGTHADNQQDRARKGRGRRRGHPAKVARAEQWRLVEQWKRGKTQRAIAKEFGISQARVSQILRAGAAAP